MTTVLNMMGPKAGAAISEAVPEVEVVDVVDSAADGEPPADLHGEVLFAAWLGSPLYERLDEIGVQWMHLPGTGIDTWPRELLVGRTVTCSRGVSAIPIAEFALAAMLAFEKRIPDVWLHAPPEQWNVDRLGELAGKTIGIIGLGGIGRAVAQRAIGFDMRVVAVRRSSDRAGIDDVKLVADLDHLLATADHLVVAAPATPATHRLLDAHAFAKVKPGVHLVNVARGALVDHDALRVALDDGRVALATLDTVDPEPVPAGHWLYEHPKVRLSAHVSWSSPKAFERITGAFIRNLQRYRAGEPLLDVIDVDEGY